MPTGKIQLDPEQLIRAARQIASEAAQAYDLYLAPEAMVAVDRLVSKRIAEFSIPDFDFVRWQTKIRKFSREIADSYRNEGARRVVDAEELQQRAESRCPYPFDLF